MGTLRKSVGRLLIPVGVGIFVCLLLDPETVPVGAMIGAFIWPSIVCKSTLEYFLVRRSLTIAITVTLSAIVGIIAFGLPVFGLIGSEPAGLAMAQLCFGIYIACAVFTLLFLFMTDDVNPQESADVDGAK